jgi:hypothetical protein
MTAEPTEKERFLSGLKKIVSVPKAEILRREREDKEARRRARARRRRGFVSVGSIVATAILLSAIPKVLVVLDLMSIGSRYHRGETHLVYNDDTTSPMSQRGNAVHSWTMDYDMQDSALAALSPIKFQSGERISGDGSKTKQRPIIPHWLELITLIAGGVISGTLGKRVWEAMRLESLLRRTLVVSLLLLCIVITVSLSELLWLFL